MGIDLVVYGATGFTGRLVAAYLRRNVPSHNFTWALAGRSQAKLQAIATNIEEDFLKTDTNNNKGCPPCQILDGCTADDKGAQRIIKGLQPTVVISTAGPFVHFSNALVAACAAAGVSYVDINGEIPWVKRVIDQHDATAKSTGALIVPCSGFDSVPSDLGAMLACKQLALKAPDQKCVAVHGVMHWGGGATMSGGTIETGLIMKDLFPDELRNPFLLGGAEKLDRGPTSPMDADVVEARYDGTLRRWLAPFGMAKINTRIVRRSAGPELSAYANICPERFCYREEMLVAVGGGKMAAKMARNAAITPDSLRKLRAAGRLPTPGNGPSAHRRQKSSFQCISTATSTDGKTRHSISISGGDPGYNETAKMVAESALCILLEDRASLPAAAGGGDRGKNNNNNGGGGVLTPSAAFGNVLVKRLTRAGMQFDMDFQTAQLPGEPDLDEEKKNPTATTSTPAFMSKL